MSMKTALVTGASKGIGREIARELGRTHHVVAIGRDTQDLARLVAELPSAESKSVDLTDPGLEDALSEVDLSELDFLVNAAAIAEEGNLGVLDTEAWKRSFDINVFAVAEITRILLPEIRKNAGQIVFINSGSGRMSYSGGLPYTATKHALRTLADCLREEERHLGVRVTSLYPGWVDTDLGRNMRGARPEPFETEDFISVDAFSPIIRTLVELPRNATIEDLIIRPTSEGRPPGV